MKISLMQKNRITGQVEVGDSQFFQIFHEAQLLNLMRPVRHPTIELAAYPSDPSRILISVTQNDNMCNSVEIYRRESRTSNCGVVQNHEPYSLLNTVALLPGRTEKITDSSVHCVFPNSYEYRAIPVNYLGDPGVSAAAAKVIVGRLAKVGNLAASGAELDDNVAISCVNASDHIIVTVSSIPPGVFSIMIKKEQLRSDSFYNNRNNRYKDVFLQRGNEIPDTSEIIIEKGVTSITGIDKDVEFSGTPRHYRYVCVLRRLRKPDILASEEELVVFRPASLLNSSNIPCSMRIVNIRKTPEESAIPNRPTYNVHFTIEANIKNKGMDFILEVLRSSGVDSAFLQEINEDRGNFEPSVGFWITRTNLHTGRKFDFGYHPAEKRPVEDGSSFTYNSSNFIHTVSITDTQSNAPGMLLPAYDRLQSGRNYRYTVQMALMFPDSFIDRALTAIDVQNPNLLGLSETERKTTLAQRFVASFESYGIMPAEGTMGVNQGTTIEERLAAGRNGIEAYCDVDIPVRHNRIKDVHSQLQGPYVLVRFRFEGNVNEVSHFLIIIKANAYTGADGRLVVEERDDNARITSVIGHLVPSGNTNRNVDDQGYYRYHDDVYHTVLSPTIYSIQAVYHDGSVSQVVGAADGTRRSYYAKLRVEEILKEQQREQEAGTRPIGRRERPSRN